MKLNLELYSNLELNLNLSLDLHRSSHKNSSKTARRRVVWWILLCCQSMCDQSYGATLFNSGFIPSRISDLKMSLNLELDANLELNLNLNLELNSRTLLINCSLRIYFGMRKCSRHLMDINPSFCRGSTCNDKYIFVPSSYKGSY